MGKGFKGVPCVYCRVRIAGTADHVIAREFFPVDKRGYLPKVPACSECNNAKSKLEHTLTAILPLGAKHDDALKAFEMVERRLALNKKLQRWLSAGFASKFRSVNGGPWQIEKSVPFNHKDFEKLCEFIIKGLSFYHWEVALGPDHFVKATFLNQVGRQHFDKFFVSPAAKVQQNLGDGVFVYEGAQSRDLPDLTLWKISIYGVEVTGDESHKVDRSSMIYGITAPRASPATQAVMKLFDSTA